MQYKLACTQIIYKEGFALLDLREQSIKFNITCICLIVDINSNNSAVLTSYLFLNFRPPPFYYLNFSENIIYTKFSCTRFPKLNRVGGYIKGVAKSDKNKTKT
jgi:hypothetical protein